MGPVICMITPGLERHVPGGRDLVERMRAAAHAGVHLIQIRRPDLDGRGLTQFVQQALLAVRGTSTRVLVNDRVDVALAAWAHGVHLRGDSVPGSRARSATPPGFLIGRSVHTPGEAAEVASGGGVDYLLFGAVFATLSKPGVAPAGADALAAACAATPLPVLAVGGMALDRLGGVAASGAAGFAAIGLFADCAPGALAALVRQARHEFDTSGGVP